MYKARAIINKEFPKLSEVLTAIKKLDKDDGGRDTRDYFSIMQHVSEISPRLRGHILTRKTGVLSYQYELALNDKTYKYLDKAVLRLTKAIKTIMNNQLSTPLFGFTVYRYELGLTEHGISPLLTYINPLNIDIMDNGDVAEIDELGNKTILEPDTILFESDGMNIRGGILRSVVLNEILANDLLLDWSNLAKRMKGIITASFDSEIMQQQLAAAGLSEVEAAKMYDDIDVSLNNIQDGNWIKTLKAFEIKLNSLVESGSSNAYAILMSELNSAIAIAVLGQANTSQLPNSGGSRAALQVLNLIRSDILYYDMIRVKDLIDELIYRDFKLNNNSGTLPPIEFKWIYDDTSDINTYANVFEVISRLNVPIDKAEFYNKLALSMPEEDNQLFLNSAMAVI